MSKKSTFEPVGPGERIHVLDALRGFAIFGILIINIGVFSGYAYMGESARNELLLADWNAVFDWIYTMFFSGKFYTLFSLLFGIGFAIQLVRAQEADRSFTRHFSRRLFFLLLIGVIHLWGIWFSDILVIYALCGYVLLLFKNVSDRGLLWWAFLILLLPGLHSLYIQLADGGYSVHLYEIVNNAWRTMDLPNTPDEYVTFRMIDLVRVIQSESWETVLAFNFIGPILRGYIVLLDGRFFKVIAMFILGLWAGRHILSHRIYQNRKWLLRVAITGFILGIPLNIFYTMDYQFGMSDTLFIVTENALAPFGYITLTAAYIASFMLLFQTGLQKTLDQLFNAVGKMALTNYIFQSVIGILLFYGVGLGLGQYLGAAGLALFVFLIFGIQIYLSNLWLMKFKYGPLEWIWRVLTYGRYIKNRY